MIVRSIMQVFLNYILQNSLSEYSRQTQFTVGSLCRKVGSPLSQLNSNKGIPKSSTQSLNPKPRSHFPIYVKYFHRIGICFCKWDSLLQFRALNKPENQIRLEPVPRNAYVFWGGSFFGLQIMFYSLQLQRPTFFVYTSSAGLNRGPRRKNSPLSLFILFIRKQLSVWCERSLSNDPIVTKHVVSIIGFDCSKK